MLSHSDLLDIVRRIVPANADEIVQLLTLTEDRSFTDLQYTPLVRLGDFYVTSPRLLAESNLVRNLACAHNLHAQRLGFGDPMQDEVTRALEQAGFKVRTEFETKIGKQKLEIDIIAWREGHLFIFECKNAYLPCTVHEMRNSYGHVVKAGKQLDFRLSLLKEHTNQILLFTSLGWDVPPTINLHTCIIIANRVFHGESYGMHPIRQGHELINVVLHGTFQVDEEVFQFWQKDDFQIIDLVQYLVGGTIVHDQLANMEPASRSYQFGNRTLVFESYQFNFEKFREQARSRYRGKIFSKTDGS